MKILVTGSTGAIGKWVVNTIIPDDGRMAWFRMMPEEFKLRASVGDFFSVVDVRDVAEAARLSLTAEIQGHQAFLLTSDENRIQIPSAEIVAKYYPNLPWPTVSKEEYLGRGEFISLVDCSRAKEVLGWRAKYN